MASTKSPFFRPNDPSTSSTSGNGGRFFRTPGGTTRRKKKAPFQTGAKTTAVDDNKEEQKSTIFGCASNLVNAIVGSGIVGLPFAIQQSGFVPGIALVIFCALLTETSLRLLIDTAKHTNVPSYETVAEAAYGNFGFYFVATNMFIMAYGALLSYLMIVKDTFSSILGIDESDVLMKRAVLFVVSSTIMLPLSCQRDMASLSKTSKMNVCFDLIMVLIVVYLAFHQGGYYENNDTDSIGSDASPVFTSDVVTNDLWKVRWDTIFVGLGVLSFAFVCQHSSFIIAGSLEKPTKERWSTVTKLGVSVSASLALLMGIVGYLGFGGSENNIKGNILNSLPESLLLSKIAKGLLGTTMLFVYPMESFVARHACMVVLFEGRQAHEGDDSSVLNRRDRRITLTVVLYLSAVIPAAIFNELGDVLAVTGAIGGSCLSYIGPGIVYLGIHGGSFLEMTKSYFGNEVFSKIHADGDEEGSIPVATSSNKSDDSGKFAAGKSSLKTILWYGTGMPIWTNLASMGKGYLTNHVTEMALKSPHPIRIGNVRFARAKELGADSYNRVVVLQGRKLNPPTRRIQSRAGAFVKPSSSHSLSQDSENSAFIDDNNNDQYHKRFDSLTTKLIRADSLPRTFRDSYQIQAGTDGTVLALPPVTLDQQRRTVIKPKKGNNGNSNYQSITQSINSNATSSDEGDDIAIEDDPQSDSPRPLDFAIAIFYIIFGIIAMFAGLASIFL